MGTRKQFLNNLRKLVRRADSEAEIVVCLSVEIVHPDDNSVTNSSCSENIQQLLIRSRCGFDPRYQEKKKKKEEEKKKKKKQMW